MKRWSQKYSSFDIEVWAFFKEMVEVMDISNLEIYYLRRKSWIKNEYI